MAHHSITCIASTRRKRRKKTQDQKSPSCRAHLSSTSPASQTILWKGAEVTLGTAMAGDLFPFVVSFPPLAPSPPPSPARRRRGGADDKPRGKWRNMGVVDSPLQSADEVPARRSSSGTGSPRRLFADGARKTLHLACNTHEKTLEWARCV